MNARTLAFITLAAAVCVCGLASAEGAKKKKFVQEGMACWYGKEFHGRRTASGEKFDMHKLTAAHRTLPFGTMVEVTNLSNDKKVVVKINDRGPFNKGLIIDLSYAAAKEIGMLRAGKAKVRLRIVKKNEEHGDGENDNNENENNDLEENGN